MLNMKPAEVSVQATQVGIDGDRLRTGVTHFGDALEGFSLGGAAVKGPEGVIVELKSILRDVANIS